MTNLSHVRTTRLLVFTVLALAATSLALAQSRPPIVNELAKTYGLDSWDQIDGVRYTWNGQFGTVNISHAWEWHPKTGEVTFQSKDKDGKPVKVTYIRTQLDSAPANVKDQIEPSFVNDNYWVFFPFHVDWDTSADVQDQGTQKLPQGTGSGKRVVVKYPAEAGGYTPGDTWELYLASTGRVEQMAYHRGGPKKPSVVICGWTGYKKAGPLLFSTEHRGTADGAPLRVWFSNVSVKLVGSDSWIDAK
jgi:hypothetical protein